MSSYYDDSQTWVTYVNSRLIEIHKMGKTASDFAEIFEDFPISEHMVQAIFLAKANGADLFIISDGNTFFLDLALSKHGLSDCFSQIIAHKANFCETGLISLTPVFPEGAHNCQTEAKVTGKTCSVHMCKGIKVSELKALGYSKTIYIGDGRNDFCAACHLSSHDLLLVREGRMLDAILKAESGQVSAEIQRWSDASEVLVRFQKEFLKD